MDNTTACLHSFIILNLFVILLKETTNESLKQEILQLKNKIEEEARQLKDR